MSSESELEARKKGLAATFSRAAATYDRVGPRFFSHFGRRLVELADLKPGTPVLDLASGRGAVLFPAAETVGPEGTVSGIDLAPAMVAETAAELARREISNARIVEMDAEKLNFPDASFEVVLCGFGLSFFPRPAQALAEVYRVLKPGGLFGATGWAASDPRWSWLAEVGLRPSAAGRPGGSNPGSSSSSGSSTTPAENRRPHHGGGTAWLQTALAEIGFADYRLVEEEADFTFQDANEWWAAEWSHGARGCLERLDPASLERAKIAAFARLEAQKEPDGLLHHLYRAQFSFARKPQTGS